MGGREPTGLPGARTQAVWLATWIALLGVIAVATFVSGTSLVSSLGIVVVLAGLVSPPRVVAVTAGVAVAFAVALVAMGQVPDQAAFRVLNVVIGSALGLGASAARHVMLGRLRRLQERDAALLAALPDAVMLLDGDGRTQFCNTAAADLLGTTDPTGHGLHDLVRHRDPAGEPCDAGCVLAGPRSAEDRLEGLGHNLVRRDGEEVVVDFSLVPVPRGGRGWPDRWRWNPAARRSDHDGTVLVLRDARPRVLAAERTADLAAARREAALQRHYLDVLERALHPVVPAVPGLDVGVSYLPAEEGAPTGGDHCDSLVLPDGRLFLLVVDAVGHGVASTRDALLLTHAARALVSTGVPIGELAARLDAMALSHGPEPISATFVATVLDPGTGRLEVAAAGHPPVLLVRADGEVSWLESSGRPVGFPLAGTDDVVTGALGPGDTVVLYTDGLIEAHRDITRGLEQLPEHARALRVRPAQVVADRLVELMLEGRPQRDDTLVVAVRSLAARSGAPIS